MKVRNVPSYQKFKNLFAKKTDPWGFSESLYEKQRFSKMLDLAKTVPHQKILEIGCAEGHFTQKLLTLTKDITAIDVSPDAIRRARKKASGVKYLLTSIDDLNLKGQKFDLTVASEVIYYINNKRPIFEKIAKSSHYLVMSNYMLWDYILAFYLKDAKLIKTIHNFHPQEHLKYCRISLWQLNS